MKRKGYISEYVATPENFQKAYWGYSREKRDRSEVRIFESNLESNLAGLLRAFATCSFRTSPYIPKEVFEPKRRMVHKLPVPNHVIQWASVLPIECWLMDTLYFRSPSCVPKKGTHYFVRQEMEELRRCSQDEVYYTVQLDVHHYFPNVHHGLMKERMRDKLKDPVLLHFLDEFIDSFPCGLVMGVKLSQLLSGLYLAPFDRMALRCFGICDDVEKFHYWQSRYVTDSFMTCRTPKQAKELANGVEYFNGKFERYVCEGLTHYSRFADNIVIKHRDKVFLHLMVELAVMTLARDFYLQVNKSWNIRPTWMGNDICGYVLYHDHIMLRKRNKKSLCRQVAKLRKKGYSERDIRLKTASHAGFASHADTKHLLNKLNMEKRLGTVVKNRKKKSPFEGMTVEQKKSIDEIVCFKEEEESKFLILLKDFRIEDSVIEKNEDGTPQQRIAIRYQMIDCVTGADTDTPTYVWKEGDWYSFSGSKVMIDQAGNDFSHEDLPLVTVIREFTNKNRKRFYKFT